MNSEVKLGMELQKIKSSYVWNDLLKFVNNEIESCYYFDRLYTLFEEFGYDSVISAVKDLAKEKEENE